MLRARLSKALSCCRLQVQQQFETVLESLSRLTGLLMENSCSEGLGSFGLSVKAASRLQSLGPKTRRLQDLHVLRACGCSLQYLYLDVGRLGGSLDVWHSPSHTLQVHQAR